MSNIIVNNHPHIILVIIIIKINIRFKRLIQHLIRTNNFLKILILNLNKEVSLLIHNIFMKKIKKFSKMICQLWFLIIQINTRDSNK